MNATASIVQRRNKNTTKRKRAEEALAGEAVLRRILVEQSRDGISILDQNGKLYEANQRFADMLGYSLEEVKKLHVFDWETRYSREQVLKTFQKLDEKGYLFETQHRRKDGTIYDVEISTNAAVFAGQKYMFCVCRDITERKRMEEALQKEQAFLSSILTSIQDGVTVLDNKLKIIGANKTSEEWFAHGMPLIGKKCYQACHNRSKPCEACPTMQTLETGKAANRVVPRHGPDGMITGWSELYTFPIFDTQKGEITGIIEYGRDVTARKQAEEALRESEEKFSKSFHASPDAMGIVTEKDGKFIDVNESYIRMTGYSKEELIGTTTDIHNWVRPEDHTRMQKMLQEKGRIYNEEFDYRTKSGEIRTRLLSLEPITINGEPCRIGVSTDITEYKRMERKLKEALADLESSSDKLKATNKELESFSYSVSHDLRSPLRSIDGFSQALLEDYAATLDEKGQDYLNRMRNASQKMGELIDGLLKLSRLTRSEMRYEKVDLTSLANEIALRLQETHDKRNVKFVIGNDLTATGDPQMLRVLLENLLGNALKFTKNTKQALIEFGSATEGEGKTYFIKDNGVGFDMAFKDKLFGAFQRLHDAAEFPGTGIGLATVQRIINRHGGSIRAEGEAGKGAAFYFTLG
jgi:PAS domain S-box-containing protein